LRCQTVSLDFDSRQAAMEHAINIQLGRRNINASQRAIAAAKLPHYSHGGNRRADVQAAILPLENKSATVPYTTEQLAKKASVSERTMRDALKVQDEGGPNLSDAVRTGQLSASAAAKQLDDRQKKPTLKNGRSTQGEAHVVEKVLKSMGE